MSRKISLALVLGSCLVCAATVSAASATYMLNMTGDQEVPGPGDADGTAMGTIFLNDVTGEISWDFSYANIADPTAMHIHGPEAPVGEGAGIFIGLGVETSGGPGTLIDSFTHSDLSEITQVLDEPFNFYVNIHNADFTPGAVRGQLGVVPEPGSITLALAGLAGVALARPRRRQR